jgi:hypothetical protein
LKRKNIPILGIYHNKYALTKLVAVLNILQAQKLIHIALASSVFSDIYGLRKLKISSSGKKKKKTQSQQHINQAFIIIRSPKRACSTLSCKI